MSALFYPLLTFFLLSMVITYWAVTAVYPSVRFRGVCKQSGMSGERACGVLTWAALQRLRCVGSLVWPRANRG